MTEDTHNKYFKSIAYNQDNSILWKSLISTNQNNIQLSSPINIPYHFQAHNEIYEGRIMQLIQICKHIKRFCFLSICIIILVV